jgi:GDP-L-fucose synthase
MPALMRKFIEAKETGAKTVTAWGTGSPLREFLHSYDAADAMIFLMKNYEGRDFVNIGTGKDMSIKALTELVAEIVGFTGSIEWDTTKPDGTPRKLMDVTRLHALGWQHKISLREGITQVVTWYLKQRAGSAK